MTLSVDQRLHRRAKWRNLINTWLILGGMITLLAICAWALFGPSGIIWTVAVGGLSLIMAPRLTPAMILRFYKARPLPSGAVPDIMRNLHVLSKRAGLPAIPKLYYVASSNMNAFAVGRPTDSAITVTDGLLRGLNLRQITGVLGHEVSHIANEDLKVMALADMVNRITGVLQTMGFVLLIFGLWQGGGAILAAPLLMLAPTLGAILQLALSRAREYDADLEAARLTGDPEGLASALATLERRQGSIWESIFLPSGRNPDPSLLRTHPKTEDRIKRLLELRSMEKTGIDLSDRQQRLPESYNPVLARPRFHGPGFWY